MFGFTKRKNSDIRGGWTGTINALSRGWDGWMGDVKSTQGKTSSENKHSANNCSGYSCNDALVERFYSAWHLAAARLWPVDEPAWPQTCFLRQQRHLVSWPRPLPSLLYFGSLDARCSLDQESATSNFFLPIEADEPGAAKTQTWQYWHRLCCWRPKPKSDWRTPQVQCDLWISESLTWQARMEGQRRQRKKKSYWRQNRRHRATG